MRSPPRLHVTRASKVSRMSFLAKPGFKQSTKHSFFISETAEFLVWPRNFVWVQYLQSPNITCTQSRCKALQSTEWRRSTHAYNFRFSFVNEFDGELKSTHGNWVKPHDTVFQSFWEFFWINGQFIPIQKGFRNFHEALLLFQDNLLPMHLGIHTGHTIPLPMQLAKILVILISRKGRGDMRASLSLEFFLIKDCLKWVLKKIC